MSVHVERDGAVTTVVIDRPAARNAIDRATAEALATAFREFDADPAGVFWGRINGKSLRWCSPRGRCADCDLRYCQVLGVGEPENHASSASVRRLTSAST